MKAIFDKNGIEKSYEIVDLFINGNNTNNTMYLTIKTDKNGKMLKRYIFKNVIPISFGDTNDAITNMSFNFCSSN